MQTVGILDNEQGIATTTFLLGESGSGKSHKLKELAQVLAHEQRQVIAISNTVFDRFTKRSTATYCCLSPSRGRWYALKTFKSALLEGQRNESEVLSKIGKVLGYAGFIPVVRARVDLGRGALSSSLETFKNLNKMEGFQEREDANLLFSLIEELTKTGVRSNIPTFL